MPDPRGKPGDLYAEVKIMVPPRLTDRERSCSPSSPRCPRSTRAAPRPRRRGGRTMTASPSCSATRAYRHPRTARTTRSSPGAAACTPNSCGGSSRSGWCGPRGTPTGRCGSPRRRWRPSPGSSGCAPRCRSTTPPSASSSTCSTGSPSWRRPCAFGAHRTGAQDCNPAARHRPEAEPVMDLNRLTQKSQQALSDAQDRRDEGRPHRGRRRAPAARRCSTSPRGWCPG